MKKLLTCTLFILHTLSLLAQKPPLDASVFYNWPSVGEGAISNNGKYVLYYIIQNPDKPATLMIHALNENRKIKIFNASLAAFTDDNRQVIYLTGTDSLSLLTLGNSHTEHIPDVNTFKLFKKGKQEWLIYLLNTPKKELILRNLKTGEQQSYTGVSEYILSQKGNTLVYKTAALDANSTSQSLNWVTLPGNNPKCIWTGSNAANLTLDAAGTQLAFEVKNGNNEKTTLAFWHFKTGMDKAMLLADDHTDGIDSNLLLDRISHFSKDGFKLFFSLKEKDRPSPSPEAVQVDIWSYTDPKLQSQQLDQLSLRSYAAVLHLDDHRIIRLQQEHEAVSWATDNVVCVTHIQGDADEEYWNAAAKRTPYIVNTNDGQRKCLNVDIRFPMLSPNGRYVTGLEYAWSNLYSYESATGNSHNITEMLPIPPGDTTMTREFTDAQPYFSKYRGLSFAAWLVNGQGVLIYDDFDIWLLDPEGKREPINLTNGYGRKNNIVFRLSGGRWENKTVRNNKKIIIPAFNQVNKNNGFYQIDLNQKSDPQLLTMGPYIYEIPDYGFGGAAPMKARDANIYLAKRSGTIQSPNYFWTKDFKSFTPISDIYPEKGYNWLAAELLTFTTLDGRNEQGVLYKPENFNATKQYPLIFHYYQRKSGELNKYHKPAGPNGDLDISWFVSHGYLVFTPDIHYTIGETGQSAYNSVVGAAKYLSSFPWVDAKKMGIQGHSFGGYETNYLVTHTNLFAAAASSSGMTNLTSDYLSLPTFHAFWCEVGICRLGTTLWERPDLYIKNSPVFQVDRAATPLLMVNNKRDGNVPFSQGIELFTALRRLGKKVWMLQYDKGDHGLGGKEYIDYVIRMTQFFDHYLKGTPAPKWMTSGIPAKLKGIESGLDSNNEIKTPGPGLLLNEKIIDN